MTTYLKAIHDQDGFADPAPGQQLRQHTEDCLVCRGRGYISAGFRLSTSQEELVACDAYTFQPSRKEIPDEYDGILVTQLEDASGGIGELLAVTGDATRGRRALSKYCADRMGDYSLSDTERIQWVVCSRAGDVTLPLLDAAHFDARWWITPSSPDIPNAVQVVRIDTAPDEDDDEIPPTPDELLVELGQLHTRALASPLPQHPAATGWQMHAASLASGFARTLHALSERDPQAAVELAAWYHGPFGDGPDPAEHTDWLVEHVAKSVDTFDQWVDEARQAAVKAKAALEDLGVKKGS